MSVPPGDQIFKQNADTRQECLHRSYSVALLLYHRSRMLSSKLGAQKNRGKKCSRSNGFRAKMGWVMVKSHPLPKRGSICLQSNVFDPEKALRHNDFFCEFMTGNIITCQTPKSALRALHYFSDSSNRVAADISAFVRDWETSQQARNHPFPLRWKWVVFAICTYKCIACRYCIHQENEI